MSSLGHFDISELMQANEGFKRLADAGRLNDFMQGAVKDLSAWALAGFIKRTPVGRYPKQVNFVTSQGEQVSFTTSYVRTGGTMRRGWTGGTLQNWMTYAKTLPVHNNGTYVSVDLYNRVKYAPWVNDGHRIVNRRGELKGMYAGQKIVESVLATLGNQVEPIVERRLGRYLEESFR